MDYTLTQIIADVLSVQLADPRNPTNCYVCLADFMFALNSQLVTHLARLRLDCHAFFDACVAILCIHRTPEELARLPLRLEASRSRCPVHSSARGLRELTREKSLHILFQSAAYGFRAAVHLGERAFVERAISAGKAFSDRHGRWPARVEQLFPGGAHAAVEGLLANCELYISEGPIAVLGDMIDVARTSILPVLASEPFRARMVDVVLKMLDPVGSGLTQRAPWLANHRLSVGKTIYLLDAFMVGPGARPREAIQFFAGYEDALLRKITAINEPLADGYEDLLEPLAFWCNQLCKGGGRTIPPSIQRWIDRRGHANCGNSPAHALLRHFFSLATSRVCAGPGCTLSALQNASGRPFSTCGQCRAPRYCSRACHRADWNGDGDVLLPHQTICRVLARFDAHACAKLELPQFIEVYERTEDDFDSADLQAIEALIESMCARDHGDVENSTAEG